MRRPFVRAAVLWALLVSLILCVFPAYAATPNDWSKETPELLEAGHLFGQCAIAMDAETGTVLFEKNPDEHMFPASTTKIMTLLLALESGIPMDTMVTVTQEAANIPSDSSVIPIAVGEQLSFQDLLYGFMMKSGNDGAVAIAIQVSGSVEQFVALMNQRAQELGCTNTHFANPHGYHNDMHYASARDLALITRAAMQIPAFREIVSTPVYTLAATNKHKAREIKTRVEMLLSDSSAYYKDCVGVKTGYTSKAGQCFVGAAKRGERTVIAVTLFSTRDYANRKWFDTYAMFEYAFTRYDSYTLRDLYSMANDDLHAVQVENAVADDPYGGRLELTLSQTTDDGYHIMTLKDANELAMVLDYFNQNSAITLSTEYLDKLEQRLPIEEGSIVGSFSTLTVDGETITGNMIASRTVELAQPSSSLWEYLKENLPFLRVLEDERTGYVVLGLLVLIVLIVLVVAIHNLRRNRRRKKIYEQRRRAYYERLRREGRLRDGKRDPYDRP